MGLSGPSIFAIRLPLTRCRTSLMAAQNLLWRTLCRACSLGGGSSPLRCSRSRSSITLHTSNTHKNQTRLDYQQGKASNCPWIPQILRVVYRPQVHCVAITITMFVNYFEII